MNRVFFFGQFVNIGLIFEAVRVQIQNTPTHREPNHLVDHIDSLVATKLTYFPLSTNMEVRPALIKDVLTQNIQQG